MLHRFAIFCAFVSLAYANCRSHLPRYNFDIDQFVGSWNVLETGFTIPDPPDYGREECVTYNFSRTAGRPERLDYGYQHKIAGEWLVTNDGFGIIKDLSMPSQFDIFANQGVYAVSVLHSDFHTMALFSACRDNEEQFYILSKQKSLDPVAHGILHDLMNGYGNLTETRPVYHEGIDCIPPPQF